MPTPAQIRRRRAAAVLVLTAVAVLALRALLSASDGGASLRIQAAGAPQTVAPAPAASPATGPPSLLSSRYGRGAEAVTVVRPQTTAPLPIVLFLHGWDYEEPSSYGPWIRHLARRGNAVIVPRYQTGPDADPATVGPAMIAGFRRALRHLDNAPRTLVVTGHSAGAAMAADYAARARALGLPVPLAVFAVYPGRAIIGTPGIPAADPAAIPAGVRLTIFAGTQDTVVGDAPARELYAAATSVPRRSRRLIVVGAAGAADHLAPLRTDRIVRTTFWRPLDREIARVRRRAAVRAVWG